MSLKIVFLISAIAVAAAIELHHQPLVLHHQSHHVELEHGHEHEHDHKPAHYEFAYSVEDKHTGDIKAQKEIRKGDQVIGTYELIDSDGYKRTVNYKSDKHSGFEAVVHREPTHIKIPIPEPQHHEHKLIATKIISSPIVHYSHAPVHHHNLLHSDEGRSDEGHGSGVSFHGSGVSYKY